MDNLKRMKIHIRGSYQRKSNAKSIDESIKKRKEAKDRFKTIRKNCGIPSKRDKYSTLNNAIERFKVGKIAPASLRRLIYLQMVMNYHDGYAKCFIDYKIGKLDKRVKK